MEKAICTLAQLGAGEAGTIGAVNAEGGLRLRLTQLGFFPGERVRKLFVSPLGDPAAYLALGAVTSIRNKDAALIEVLRFESAPAGVEVWD